MAITTTEELPKPTPHSQTLRSELKEWERAFAAANAGRKAGPNDIKQHPEIASKYKQYAQLRPPPRTSSPLTRKRAHPPSPAPLTPPKRPQSSPPRPRPSSSLPGPYDSTPPHYRPSLGPTPQKNGLALGLFDLLSRSRSHEKYRAPSTHPLELQTTPSKGPGGGERGGMGAEVEGSAGRRRLRGGGEGGRREGVRTPESEGGGTRGEGLGGGRETPEFLRRGWGDAGEGGGGGGGEGEEGGFSWSPVAVKMPRRAAGRGLSVLVRGLRGLEDEMLDEEMEVLREVEAGEWAPRGGGEGMKMKGARVLVGDSQGGEMPLGADGEGCGEESLDEEVGKGGRGGKRWKKKGQKRTTRRVVMRPVVGKWKPEPEWRGPGGSDTDDDVVADTQVGDAGAAQQGGEDGDDIGDAQVGTADKGARSQAVVGKKDGLVDATVKSKKAPRKVSSTAHANYRALKIKNKHSKGKAGGKYGRRR